MSYSVCHGIRLTMQDDYFQVIYYHYTLQMFSNVLGCCCCCCYCCNCCCWSSNCLLKHDPKALIQSQINRSNKKFEGKKVFTNKWTPCFMQHFRVHLLLIYIYRKKSTLLSSIELDKHWKFKNKTSFIKELFEFKHFKQRH
jgi:hypothetical protein